MWVRIQKQTVAPFDTTPYLTRSELALLVQKGRRRQRMQELQAPLSFVLDRPSDPAQVSAWARRVRTLVERFDIEPLSDFSAK